MIMSHIETLYSGTATATGNTSATPITTKYDKEGIFYLDVTAASGTGPTLDIILKVYDDITAKWYELASFDRKVGTCQDVGYVQYGLDGKIAVFYVLGGTSPSFTFTVTGHFKEE